MSVLPMQAVGRALAKAGGAAMIPDDARREASVQVAFMGVDMLAG